MKKQKIKLCLKIISFSLVGIVVVIGTLVAAAWIFFEKLGYNEIVITNDTIDIYEITPILQSHDNAKIYRDEQIRINPNETLDIKGGFDNFSCLDIKGLGSVEFDTRFEHSELGRNFFGGEVKKFYVEVSTLLTNAKKTPCLLMNYIDKIPPRKISPDEIDKIKKQAMDADVTWKTYNSKEGGISFEYPQQFFLLDRSKDDKRIYISPKEISFNDFFNRYDEPIEISLKDKPQSNYRIQTLENKNVSQGTINGKNVLLISGTVPENRPYYAFDVFAIFFPDQEISIIADNEFQLCNITELEAVVRKIAATLVIE